MRVRDLCRSMDCNKTIIEKCEERMESDWINWQLKTMDSVKDMIANTTIEQIIEDYGIIGTTWYIKEPCESVMYHSIASSMAAVLNMIFRKLNIPFMADILTVKEKSLGYDRSKTIKISTEESDTLCYVAAQTEVCKVPKKCNRSTGLGLKIVSLTSSRPGASMETLLAGQSADVMSAWLKGIYRPLISQCLYELENADTEKIVTVASALSEITDSLNHEVQKIKSIYSS